MNFSFPEELSKDLILSRFSEEQIMEYYLRMPIKKGLFRSPLRKDKNPTCSIFRNAKGTLIFKDFATGQYLNAFEIVETLFNCNYYEALKIIANDFGIIHYDNLQKNLGRINKNPIKVKDKEVSKIRVEIQDFTELELKWWQKFGISKDILNHFNVYSCKHIFLNGNLIAKSQQHCPIFGYYGGKIQKDKEKIELWKCYFPTRKKYRFIGNYPSYKIQGYEQIPKKGKLLVITKSMKDCLSMYSCKIPAIAPNSETLFISDNVLNDLKSRFKYIVVIYDNDLPGIQNMKKIRESYPELNYFYIPRSFQAKDFSDFYAKYGRKETLKQVKIYLQWLKEYGMMNFESL